MGSLQDSHVLQSLSKAYAFSMNKDFARILKDTCYGCINELQNPVDHLCVVYSPLCQIKHCFQDLRSKVNGSEVHDFFEILMVYTYPETQFPSKYKHFNYRQSLLNDENSVLTQLVIRELLLLID